MGGKSGRLRKNVKVRSQAVASVHDDDRVR